MNRQLYWLSNKTPFTLYLDNSTSAADARNASPDQDILTTSGNSKYCSVPNCSAQQYFYSNHITLFAVDQNNAVAFSFCLWADDKSQYALQYSYDGVYFNIQALPTYGDVSQGFGLEVTYEAGTGVAAIAAFSGQSPASKAQLPLVFGQQDIYPSISAAGMLPTIIKATQGGTATAAFFQTQNQIANLVNYLNDVGSSAWQNGTDPNGNPCMVAMFAGQSETISFVLMGEPVQGIFGSANERAVRTDSSPSANADAAKTQEIISAAFSLRPAATGRRRTITADQNQGFRWGGANYNVVGSITTALMYNQTPFWYLEVPAGIGTIVPASALLKLVWSDLATPLLRAMLSGVIRALGAFANWVEMGSVAQGLAIVAAEACEAASSSAVLAGAGAVTVTGGLALVGLCVVVALPFIMSALLHYSYQTLRFYNLTAYNVTWALADIQSGQMANGPAVALGSAALLNTIPGGANSPINNQLCYREADFNFSSNSGYQGFQYALSLTVTDPTNNAAVADGAVAFDIPWAGDNSLAATLAAPTPITKLYDSLKKADTQTASLTLPNSQKLNLTVTYDYLSGEHPLPSGQQAYTYNSLAVLSVAPS